MDPPPGGAVSSRDQRAALGLPLRDSSRLAPVGRKGRDRDGVRRVHARARGCGQLYVQEQNGLMTF